MAGRRLITTANHVIASAGYAVYDLPWTRLSGNYFWDGAFVHNTPLKAVTKSSKPVKTVYVTNVFPVSKKSFPLACLKLITE